MTAHDTLRLVVARHEAERYPESAETLDVAALRAEVLRLTNARIGDQLAVSILLEILNQGHIKLHLTPTDIRMIANVKGGRG